MVSALWYKRMENNDNVSKIGTCGNANARSTPTMKPFNNPIVRWLDRWMPTLDTALIMACVVWGAICVGCVGAAILWCP